MPPEIRNQIYGYLVDSKVCDQVEAANGKGKAQFHTNILSVNKKTYGEAHGILYGTSGPIVTVAFYLKDADTALEQGLVPFRRTRYTRSIVGRQLHIVVRPSFVPVHLREPFAFVLVGMEDIKNFARFLKFMNWAENDGRGISYEFNFEACQDIFQGIHFSPEETAQVHSGLVKSFSGLRASCQTCTSKGLTNPNLETSFLQKLNNRVIWLYAQTFEMFTGILALYNDACQLSVEGRFNTALRIYDHTIGTYMCSIGANPLLQTPDTSIQGSLAGRLITLMTAAQYSRALIYILGTYSDQYRGNLTSRVPMRDFRRALQGAEGMMDMLGGAITLLVVPHKVNLAILKILATLRTICGGSGEDIASAWVAAAELVVDEESKLTFLKLADYALSQALNPGSPNLSATRREMVKTFIEHLPFPLVPFDSYPPVKSTTVLNERHLLDTLKYNGPLYKKAIKPVAGRRTEPGSTEQVTYGDKVDPKHCQEVIQELAVQIKKHKGVFDFSVWISREHFFFKGSTSAMRNMGIGSNDITMGYPFENLQPPF
ncbi:hypothetical protein TWF730_001517 [Orbilia blumenaviensis]|uniref:Uncharacterized protein n=1 Tax=Orbilia blumenaviensis TaxID=1796055 RepID=A0AAV9UIS9_9PEZI